MNDLIQIPTIEQINLEHRLANSKAAEAIQHATNCGLMLLQAKASLKHGEWLPWLEAQIESGHLTIKKRQAQTYMHLASNTQRAAYLEESSSIRAALELLSDKEPGESQPSLPDIETERAAKEKAEQEAKAEREARQKAEEDRAVWQKRQKESQQESNERSRRIRALESELAQLKASDVPPVVIEKIIETPVIPPQYADLEAAIAAKQKELERITQDTQTALDRNSSVYQHREQLTREVDALNLLLSKHQAAEREQVEHKRITDVLMQVTAVEIANLRTLEHTAIGAQLGRWEQAAQQLVDAAYEIRHTMIARSNAQDVVATITRQCEEINA